MILIKKINIILIVFLLFFYSNLFSLDQLDIFYTGETGHKISFSLSSLVESYIESNDTIQVESVHLKPIIFENNRYLAKLPADMDLNSVLGKEIAWKKVSNVNILQTNDSFIIPININGIYFLDKIYDYFQNNRGESTKYPTLTRIESSFDRASNSPITSINIGQKGLASKTKAGISKWQFSMVYLYNLKINKEQVTIAVIGRPYGGIAKVMNRMLQERLISSSSLYFELGNSLSLNSYPEFKQKLSFYEDLDLDAYFIARDEMRTYYHFFTTYKKNKGKIPFIASNVFKDDTPLFDQYKIIKRRGIKIGLLGLVSDVGFTQKGKKGDVEIDIKDPIEVLNALMPVVEPYCDAIIVLTDLDEPEIYDINQKIEGIDIFIGTRKSELPPYENKIITIKNTNQNVTQDSSFLSTIYTEFIGKLELMFEQKSKKKNILTQVTEKKYPLDDEIEAETTMQVSELIQYYKYFSNEEYIMPDPRKIWPDSKKKMLDNNDLTNLIASVILKKTNAEVVVMPYLKELDMHIMGNVSKNIFENWISGTGQLISFFIDGNTLSSLYDSYNGHDVKMLNIDDDYRVNGTILDNDEKYLVYTSSLIFDNPAWDDIRDKVEDQNSDFLEKNDKYFPEEKGKNINISDITTEFVSKHDFFASNEESLDILRKSFNGSYKRITPVWRINIDELSFDFSGNHNVNNENYTDIRNARVNSYTEASISAFLSANLSHDSEYVLFSVGPELEYSFTGTDYGDYNIDSTTYNEWQVGGDLYFKVLEFESLDRASFGPYIRGAYISEFDSYTEDEDLLRQVETVYGLRLYDNSLFPTIEAGYLVMWDITSDLTQLRYGVDFLLEAEHEFASGHYWYAFLEGQYFIPSELDSTDDLAFTVNLNNEFEFAFIDEIAFSFYLDMLLYKGATIDDLGLNIISGLSLSFARIFKP
ncbi:MAG: hypothetical protein ABIA04_07710 [Pseudomonadota bacterium]